MKNIFTSLVEWFLAGSKLGVNETLSWRSQLTFGFEKGRRLGKPSRPRFYRDFIETLSGHYREKNHYLTTKFAAAFLMLLTLGVGQVWGVDYQQNYGWENNDLNSWAKNSATAINVRSTGARTGTYCVDLEANASSSSLKLSGVTFTKNYYHHVILYAKTDVAAATIQVNLNGNNPGNSTPGTSWTRITHAYNYTSSTGTKNIEIKFPSATNSNHVHGYFDDAVFYTSTSSTTDVTKPSSATSASATTSSISWTNGSDTGTGATGIQNTLIWRRTGGSSDDLTLNNQGRYSLTSTEGPSTDQSGHWTLVSATVGAAATSYAGTFAGGDRYAIVHRDLAYNYSTPTYVTITAAPAHPGYTFHYGTDGSSDWTIADFTQVGSTTEWKIEDFVIPDKTHLYVGYQGNFKGSNDLGTSGSSSSNTVRWSDVPSEVCDPGCKWQGQPFLQPMSGSTLSDYPVGQATGAVGKLTIWSDSGDKNLYLSFTPNGYVFRRNGTDALMTNVSGNVYSSPALEINADNCRQTIGVGLEKEDGHYSGAAHSLEVQHLFLRVNSNWSQANAKFSIYNINESAFTSGFMTLVPGETDLYEGWVAAGCTQVIFVRHNSTATYPSWDSGNKWNQTGDLTLQSGKNLFTLPNGAWDGSTTTWGNYTKKGKFYITATDITKNFGCHFVPGYTVTYNPGSGGVTGDAVEDLKIYGETLTLRGAGLFTRTGYTQTGWSTSNGGSKTNNLGASYTANAALTLYPVWTPSNYTVTLEGQSATTAGTTSVSVTYNTNTNIGTQITIPEKTGYIFGGYYTGTNGSGYQVISPTGWFNWNVTGYVDGSGNWVHADDVTLYAWWKTYTFHSASSGAYPWPSTNFARVGSSPVWQITNYTIPSTTKFYVGVGGEFWNSYLGEGDAHGNRSASVEKNWTDVPAKTDPLDDESPYNGAMFMIPINGDFYLEPSNYALGLATGATGTLLVTDTMSDLNLYVRFKPDGYGLTYNSKSLPFTYAGDNYKYETALVTLDASDISAANFKVGLQTGTAGTYADCSSHSYSESASTIGGRTNSTTPAAGSRGKFRIWDDSPEHNWYLTFAPVFTITYDCDDADSGCPANAEDQTNLPNPLPSAPVKAGYTFDGWFTNAGKTVAAVAGAALTENTTLYAKWTAIPSATVYNFDNGIIQDWGLCVGRDLTLSGSQSGVSYQLYKDGVASGDPKPGTGSALTWHASESGVYTVRSVANASYAETAMNGSADLRLQDPTLVGENTVGIGETITLTHPGYTIIADNWTSSNPAIATVNNSGVVTGVSSGVVTITLHGVSGCNGTKVITVDCAKSLSKVVLTSKNTGTVTGYNGNEYAGTAYINCSADTQTADVDASHAGTETGYKLGSKGLYVFATIGKGDFQTGDKVRITITKLNDAYTFPSPIEATTAMDIYFGDNSSRTRLTTITGVTEVGTYEYTLSAADVSTINGAGKKGLGIYRDETRKQNYYIYSVEILGCRDWATWNVTYNDNGATGGSAPTDATDYANGATVTVLGNTGSMTNGSLSFDGWNTKADGSGINFAAGATFSITQDTALYAKWICPTITATATAANGTAAQTYNKGDVAGAMTATGGTIFQWYRSSENDVESDTRAIMEGQTSATLTPSTAVFGTTYYFCVVSNACGNKDTTNTVAITIEDPNPAPTADWTGTTTDPTHGAGGYTVTVVAKNYDGSTLWDGTLTDAMLSASDGITLSGVTVNNTTKTITATYAVTAAAETPITFTLSLPATATHKAADLTYDVAFTECAASAGATYNIRVRKNYEKNANNVYRWVTAAVGEITTNVGSSIGSSKASAVMASVFDSIASSTSEFVWIKPYIANIKTIRIYGNINGNNISVSSVHKMASYAATSSGNAISGYTVTYEGGGENTGEKGNHYVDIELDEPLAANEILAVRWSSSGRVKPAGAAVTVQVDGGSLATTLAWSNSQLDGATLQKGEYDADFTITATRGNANATASLGAISYESSDESVATVNAATGRVTIADNIDFGGAEYKTTTITATLAASGCYQGTQITYILRVNKQECEDEEGTIASTNLGCAGVLLTLSGYSAGATIAWYKDDAVIPGETGTTYTATSAGSYYATTTLAGAGHCTMTSNTVVIEDVVLSATAIVDQWYIKNGRRTPDIELVATTGATSFIVKSGSTVIWNSDGSVSTGFGGCEFYMDANGTIYLKGEKADGSATTGLTAGDETLTFYVSGCGDADPVNIVIHKQTTPVGSIAFIVDGDKDGAVSDVDASKTTSRPIWTYLSSYYTLTGCNAYWTNDEKTLREYYSQYDAILITDDPDTGIKPSSGKAYVNALGTMVDVRPLLTLEAFVGKYGASSNWHIGATPHSPKPRQYEMKLQCRDHTIFNSLTTEPLPDNVRMVEEDGIEYYYVTMVDRTHSTYSGLGDNTDTDDKPALQGFENSVIPGVLGVGTINDNTYGTLRGGVERQEEPAARMIILGIQHQAMAALTPQGKLVIKQALDYLLLTNMDDVDDCSNYFIGGTAGHETDWHTGTNWTAGHAPDKTVTARILAPCTVSGATKASAAAVDIVTGGRTTRYKSGASDCEGTLTIQPTGILVSDGRILQIAEAPHFVEGSRVPTTPAILKVEANSTNTGALIFDNEAGKTQATVEMYVPSHWEVDGATGKKKKYWSYIGVPIKNVDIPNYFYLGFTYYYDETAEGAWVKRGDGTVLQPFEGIGASMKTEGKEIFTGTLASTETQEITLTKTTAGGNGENLIGNSWTAPIQIAAFDAADFGSATATVYVYNSGRDEQASGSQGTASYGGDGTTTAGQWITVPVATAKVGGYTGLKVIPAMNAFQVNTASETTLTLDYDKLVRPATNDVNAPLRAQKRNTAEANEIDGLLRVRVTGEKTHTDVWLLQDARFDYGFDNGWEAGYQDCDDRSSQLYAVSEIGRMAFLAQPDIDGTILGFAPSRDGDEYTFSFYYLGDEVLYLNDLKQQTSTLVSDENIYRFTYEEGDTNRFIISATPFGSPSVTTGNEEVLHPDRVKKVVYRDHVYIIRGGRIYDVIGKIVR